MGGGDPADSEEGHEELEDEQRRHFAATQSPAASHPVWARFIRRGRCRRDRHVIQRHGGICRGSGGACGYPERLVGEHRPGRAQATVSDEGATVGVAAAVAVDLARIFDGRSVNVQYRIMIDVVENLILFVYLWVQA